MLLKCFAVTTTPPRIVPARPARAWMDAFPSRHPYRCLPLAIANTHGWEVLSPGKFSVSWDGGAGGDAIRIEPAPGFHHIEHFAQSNFERGILTLHTGYLFRTEPGWDLVATGPLNEPKNGVAPLTGVIETDWLPYPFTMNWAFTTPTTVTFEKDEPFCAIFPVPHAYLEQFQPEVLDIDDDPELKAQYDLWRSHRERFMTQFKNHDPATLKQAWQRFYFRGQLPESEAVRPEHRIKLGVREPVDRRKR
jgi:hypothetical protein